jgi:hypothetical protein
MARVSGQLPTLAKVGVNGQSCAGRVRATFDGKDSSRWNCREQQRLKISSGVAVDGAPTMCSHGCLGRDVDSPRLFFRIRSQRLRRGTRRLCGRAGQNMPDL